MSESAERLALRAIVNAWRSLPGGKQYTAKEIGDWLDQKMLPTIERAEAVLAEPRELPRILRPGGNGR